MTKRALLIGNCRYEANPLTRCVDNARRVGEVLERMGFSVAQKNNLAATGLKKCLKDLAKDTKEGDVVRSPCDPARATPVVFLVLCASLVGKYLYVCTTTNKWRKENEMKS